MQKRSIVNVMINRQVEEGKSFNKLQVTGSLIGAILFLLLSIWLILNRYDYVGIEELASLEPSAVEQEKEWVISRTKHYVDLGFFIGIAAGAFLITAVIVIERNVRWLITSTAGFHSVLKK